MTVEKPNGDVLVCLDLQEANKNSQRDGEMKVFTKVDMNTVLHEVELHPVTTFAAPTGLYRYKRIVFVFNVASEKFNHVISSPYSLGGRFFVSHARLIEDTVSKYIRLKCSFDHKNSLIQG